MSPRKNVPIVDALPENYPYRDDGCDVSPSCLYCPLPWCKYDDPVTYHRNLRENRDMEVIQVKRDQGKSVPQLARHFGVSERTIHRILERARHGFSQAQNFEPRRPFRRVATLADPLATTKEQNTSRRRP